MKYKNRLRALEKRRKAHDVMKTRSGMEYVRPGSQRRSK